MAACPLEAAPGPVPVADAVADAGGLVLAMAGGRVVDPSVSGAHGPCAGSRFDTPCDRRF
jgi:hypothetical protein